MSTSQQVINLRKALAEYGEILTVQEVAAAMKVNDDTITNWLGNGSLRGFKIGRAWRIVKDDFLEDIVVFYNVAPSTAPHPGATAGD